MESGKHEKNGTSPVRECDEIVSYLNEEGEEAEEEAEVISEGFLSVDEDSDFLEASEDEGMDRVNLVDLEDESEVYEAGEPPADQEDIEEMDDEMEHCMDDNGDVRVNLEEFTEVEEAEDINAASCVESELSTDIHLEGNNSESVAEEDVTKQQILAAQKAPSKLSAVPAHPNAIKSPLQRISTADVKKTVVGKPGTEASNKTPAKVVPAQRSAAVTRKLNAVPAKPAVVAKSNPAKPTVGQKIVTSTPKPSQNLKAVCLKAANISAIPNSHRVNDSSQNKASPSLETHDRTFDVQVDDFDGIDVEKPSDQSKTCVSMKTANKAGFTTNTRSGAIAKSSEQSNGSVDEGGFPVVTVAEESSKTDNAEPGEKKDENDAKPENSEAAITNLKTKDEKSTSISHNLWVSGLSSTTKATDLKALFGKYGKVLGAKVVTSARSPGWRCYGLVTIASADETTKCIQHLHRTELHGKMISVERVKTGGPARTIPVSKLGATNHSAHSGTIQKTSISGCSNIALNKSDDKKPAAPDKEGVKKCSEDDKKKGIKDEGKKSGKKEDQKESNKDVRHGVKSSKDHQRDKKSDKPSRKSGRESRYTSGIRDRNRYKDSEKRWEQRARDILSFEKIRAERERERLRQKELQLRSEERFRMEEIEKERQRQKAISRKQREEALQLEREKEKLRIEREKLEHERQKAEQLCKETARLKKIAENKIRREQDRLAAEQRAVKRPFDSTRLEMDNLWEKSAKKPCKESDFKSVFSEAIQYSNKSSEYELKAERYGHSGHFHQRQNNYHNSDKEDHRRLDESRLDRDYRKERPDKRGSHQDLQGEVGARPNHNLPGGGTGNIWSGQNSLWPSDHVRHDSRSEWKTERNMQPVVQRHETTEAVTAWGGPVNNQRKVEAGWGRDSEQDRTVSDRWIGMTSTELSQHQRGIGDMTNYNQRGIGDNSNYKSLRGHESNLLPASMTQGYLKSSNMNSGSRVSRQADSRFNIAAITARRF